MVTSMHVGNLPSDDRAIHDRTGLRYLPIKGRRTFPAPGRLGSWPQVYPCLLDSLNAATAEAITAIPHVHETLRRGTSCRYCFSAPSVVVSVSHDLSELRWSRYRSTALHRDGMFSAER